MKHNDFVELICNALSYDCGAIARIALAYIAETSGTDDERHYQLGVVLNYIELSNAPDYTAPNTLPKFKGLFAKPPKYMFISALKQVLQDEEYDMNDMANYIRTLPGHEKYLWGLKQS